MKIDFNPYAAAALQKAEEDALACKQNYIGTEHILLGLLDQKESLAGQVLYACGLTYEMLLESVLAEAAALGMPEKEVRILRVQLDDVSKPEEK